MLAADETRTERPPRHRLRYVAAALVAGIGYLALRAFLFERASVKITRHTITGALSKPLRIAHVSDLHLKDPGPWAFAIVDDVRKQSPDIVVITGDLAAPGVPLVDLRGVFKSFAAPLGVWMIRGGADDPVAFAKFCPSTGAHCLDNTGRAAREDVWIGGTDDPITGKPDAERALVGAGVGTYKILLIHAPDHFAKVAGLFDLALAGHSHGGQLRIPGLRPLFLPEQGRRYPEGWFNENRSSLFVSRGLGTAGLPARLFCPPEIAIIDIQPAN